MDRAAAQAKYQVPEDVLQERLNGRGIRADCARADTVWFPSRRRTTAK